MGNGSPKVKRMKHKVSRHKSPIVEDMAARFYREVNPRREQEIMDSRMIQEDHNAIANLSPSFINRQFNANRYMQSLGKRDEASEVGE
jgi:hypothetical protein